MKIHSAIITGANGFIGNALTKELLEQGCEVWAVVRNTDSILPLLKYCNLHVVKASFEEYEELPKNICHCGIDAFFHFAWAGYGTATNDYKVQIDNVRYACAAANAAAQLGTKRFVFADSFHEFMMSEDAKGNNGGCSIYGSAKACAQSMCKTVAHNANMDFVGVMFGNIFGPGDRSNRSVNTFIRKLQKGHNLDLIDGGKRNGWLYIDDCIPAIIAVAKNGGAGRVYYIGGEPQRFDYYLTIMRDALSPMSVLNFGVYPDNSFIEFEKIDQDALYEDTGYQIHPTDLRESILKTARWLQEYDQESKVKP